MIGRSPAIKAALDAYCRFHRALSPPGVFTLTGPPDEKYGRYQAGWLLAAKWMEVKC